MEAKIEPRYLDLKNLMVYLSLGRDNCRKIGRDADALIKAGKKHLYDKSKIDRYMEYLQSIQGWGI